MTIYCVSKHHKDEAGHILEPTRYYFLDRQVAQDLYVSLFSRQNWFPYSTHFEEIPVSEEREAARLLSFNRYAMTA